MVYFQTKNTNFEYFVGLGKENIGICILKPFGTFVAILVYIFYGQ
jgi:hypothetical protein